MSVGSGRYVVSVGEWEVCGECRGVEVCGECRGVEVCGECRGVGEYITMANLHPDVIC